MASCDLPGVGIAARALLREALLHAAAGVPPAADAPAPRSAALAAGSAETHGTSAAENVARALAARLETHGVATALHAATDFLRDDKATAAAQAVAASDLFVRVTPLYVDALSALATRALECAARARAGGRPLGAGAALDPAMPLDTQHGPAEHGKNVRDLAAPCLARGEAIPPAAIKRMAASPMPHIPTGSSATCAGATRHTRTDWRRPPCVRARSGDPLRRALTAGAWRPPPAGTGPTHHRPRAPRSRAWR